MKALHRIGKLLAVILVLGMVMTQFGAGLALADAVAGEEEPQYVTRVVTIGADLSEEQKANIFRFFGTTPEEVTVMIITNADERAHLEHLFPSDVIGWQTFSCAYVSPTQDGRGIQVKTANMNYVTGNMIASTLSTSGVENCDVLAAAPFEVSGTGALTGVIMAYEEAIGQELDAEKKELANEELVTTGDLAEEVGQDEAILVVNDIKIQVVREGAAPEDTIVIVDNVLETVNAASVSSVGRGITVSDDVKNKLYAFAQKFASLGYNLDSVQTTLQRVAQNVTESTGIADPIMDTFEEKISTKIPEDSILYTADDSVFGGNTTATFDDPADTEEVTFEGSLSADGVSLTPHGTVNANYWVDGTNVLKYADGRGYGLMDIDGKHLTEAKYDSLYGEYGYVEAAIYNGTVNDEGLLNVAGQEIIPCQYGNIDFENRYWVVCWNLTDATEDDADAHDFDDNYYKITTADIYFLENEQAKLVATLPRAEIGEYYANGKTINVENRSTGEVSCYNSDFEAVETGLKSAYSAPDGDLTGVIHTFRENRMDGLKDAQNNVLLEPAYPYIYLYEDRDYVLISSGSYEGLIDWDGNEIIFTDYDSIESNYYGPVGAHSRSSSGYSGNGYITAVEDGKYVFLDVNGNVTYDSGVSQTEYEDEVCGASVLYEDASGQAHILAADGKDTVISGYNRVSPLYYGSGMLYRVQSEDYSYGLIDWHGNVIFEPKFDSIYMSADGTHLLVYEYYAGTQLFDVAYEGPVHVAPVKEEPSKPEPETETQAAKPAEPETTTQAVQPAAPEPATQAAQGAGGSVSEVLSGIKALAIADYEGNKDNIVLLLKGVSELLGEENAEAAYLVDSAVQLIGYDAADSDSISLLIDSALDVLVEPAPAPEPEPVPEPETEPEPVTEPVTEPVPEPGPEPETEAATQGAAETIAQVLDGIKALAASDLEGNKDNIILLLNGVSASLGEENAEAASLLDSAVQLINLDAADSDSISLLVDAALAALAAQ
ncbi:MAG: DUF1002 domain-containing protein [Parasporobacterium sp.]|nr:DUF1002 domain-containing protein [Parasporobacterium sp.]